MCACFAPITFLGESSKNMARCGLLTPATSMALWNASTLGLQRMWGGGAEAPAGAVLTQSGLSVSKAMTP